ncbi:MAG: XkdF-like putative serine protease domain-containing protein [Hyphomicrobiaceae bacterium]
MANEKPAKLTLTKLDFLSSCDFPAQGEGGAALLLKRNADKFTLKAKVAKMSDELGLVFGYAFATSMDGGATPHVDYQNDAIDPDFLKVVTEFIEAGGKTDVNHDFEKDGKIVYAWPLLPEINKAMGIESDVFGLAVAVKPSAETYKRFKDGELTGFSIAGEGVRAPLDKARKSKVRKTVSLFTDEVDGHQHQIDIGDDGYTWCSWATSAGADNGHSHAIARDENGAIVVLADSGHSHQLAEGQPAVIVVPEGAVVVTEVAMRRIPAVKSATRASDSPRPDDTHTVNSQGKETMTTKANETNTTDLEKQVVTLTKRNETLERIAKLSGAHKAHYDTLTGSDAEGFLAKSDVERNQAIETAEKSDPVEFTLDGVAYRKSTQGYALAKRIREQDATIEKAQVREIAKSHLGKLAGKDETHDFIVRAVKNSGGSKEQIDEALVAMKGWNEHAAKRETAPGMDGSSVDDTGTSPLDALTKGLVEFCKAEKIDDRSMWTVGLPKFEQTEKGRALKTSYDESLAG